MTYFHTRAAAWLAAWALIAFIATPITATAATTTAASCQEAAVQSAINAAGTGDTIVVPAGSCTWTSQLTIPSTKGIHLHGQAKGAVTIAHSAGAISLINASLNTAFNLEISNLTFMPGSASSSSGAVHYIDVNGTGKPGLVHDNYFRAVNFSVDCIRWESNGGVIWNNKFESIDADGAGSGCIQIKNPNLTTGWTTDSTMGMADTNGTTNVYIETNVFNNIFLQAIDTDDNMRTVIRYNAFNNSGFASHGADTSPVGARHFEIYNNTFVFSLAPAGGFNYPFNLNWWVYWRGGTGIVTDNVMPDLVSTMWGTKPKVALIVQNVRRNSGPYPCWKAYPAPHQVGQSFASGKPVTDPIYIWNNTGAASQVPGIMDYNPDECGSGVTSAQFIQSGRDFVVGTAKPGYTKYTYPHPLTNGVLRPMPPTGNVAH